MRNALAAGVLLLLVGTAALYAGLEHGEGPEHERIRTLVLTGSSTVAPLAAEIGRRFEERRPGIRVDVQAGGSGRGMADARRGLADIGMVSRALEPGEETPLRGHTVARDGIALVVHAGNPIPALSAEQVRQIWRGEVERWEELGFEAALRGPITVVHKAEGRATLEVFLDHFGLRNRNLDPDVVIGGNRQAVKTVAGNPLAVGYISIGEIEAEAAAGVPVRALPLDGVEATREAVASGTYPLSRELVLVTRGEPAGAVADFLDFARSSVVADLVREQGYVPLAAP